MEKDFQVSMAFKEYFPPLWCSFWLSEYYFKTYNKWSFTGVGALFFVHNNELQGYMQTNTHAVLLSSLRDRLSKEYLDEWYESYQENLAVLVDLQKTVSSKKDFSSEELIDILEKLYKHYGQIAPLSNISYFLSDALEAELQDILTKEGLSDVSLSSLIHPQYQTYLESFVAARKNIQQTFFADADLTEELVKNCYAQDEEFAAAVNTFAKEFEYMTALNMPLRTVKSFFADIATKVEEKDRTPVPSSIARQMTWMNQLMFFKDEISTFLVPFVKHGFENVWNAIAIKLGVSMQDLEQIHVVELIDFLKNNIKPSVQLIADRKDTTVYYYTPASTVADFKQGAEAKVYFEELKEKHVEKVEVTDVTEFTGKVGSVGVAEGIVKVLDSAAEMEKLQDGEILVAAYTAPEFVPAMKRALAIITDTGGITSHAAIVSRELGVPCIVGTKIATQVLKDGDRVKVDAQNGVVTKL